MSAEHVTPRLEQAMALFQHAKTYGIVRAILVGAGHNFKMVDDLKRHARIAGIVSADPTPDLRIFRTAQKN